MNLIIENFGPQDFPKALAKVLEYHFKENRQMWYFFHDAFWPKNRPKTIETFMALPEGSNIVCEHTFDGFIQLELIVNLLLKFKAVDKKINFFILNPCLDVNLKEYIEKSYSDIAPKEIEDDYKAMISFKLDMNEKLFEVLEYHKVYQILRSCYHDKVLLESEDVLQMTKEIIMTAESRQ